MSSPRDDLHDFYLCYDHSNFCLRRHLPQRAHQLAKLTGGDDTICIPVNFPKISQLNFSQDPICKFLPKYLSSIFSQDPTCQFPQNISTQFFPRPYLSISPKYLNSIFSQDPTCQFAQNNSTQFFPKTQAPPVNEGKCLLHLTNLLFSQSKGVCDDSMIRCHYGIDLQALEYCNFSSVCIRWH